MKGSGVLTCKYVVFLCFQEGLVTMHDLLDAQWVYDNTKDGRFNKEKSPGFPWSVPKTVIYVCLIRYCVRLTKKTSERHSNIFIVNFE